MSLWACEDGAKDKSGMKEKKTGGIVEVRDMKCVLKGHFFCKLVGGLF